LGNGGNDTFNIGSSGGVTEVGGFGNDSHFFGNGAEHNLLFGNEGNDTIVAFSGLTGAATVFAGQGNDSVLAAQGADTLQGNEGNDTIQGDAPVGSISIDTISGGAGNDVFSYVGAGAGGQDGNNAAAGGPIERITDVNWAEDRFDTPVNITLAQVANIGAAANLNAAANEAINLVTAANGGTNTVAAQFTFGGNTYLAINLLANGFQDANDLLIDITGATGTIATTNFI
jgi:Ca2+-binding RTX toxin-like protein